MIFLYRCVTRYSKAKPSKGKQSTRWNGRMLCSSSVGRTHEGEPRITFFFCICWKIGFVRLVLVLLFVARCDVAKCLGTY